MTRQADFLCCLSIVSVVCQYSECSLQALTVKQTAAAAKIPKSVPVPEQQQVSCAALRDPVCCVQKKHTHSTEHQADERLTKKAKKEPDPVFAS